VYVYCVWVCCAVCLMCVCSVLVFVVLESCSVFVSACL